MSIDSRLTVLPPFQIRSIRFGTDNALVAGAFSRVEGIAVDDRGWLFVSDSESTIADIVALDGHDGDLDVPNWSMTRKHRSRPLSGSVGIWLCERCFDRYLKAGNFSFLVRSPADSESRNGGGSST
jgi:hypothetical protein